MDEIDPPLRTILRWIFRMAKHFNGSEIVNDVHKYSAKLFVFLFSSYLIRFERRIIVNREIIHIFDGYLEL